MGTKDKIKNLVSLIVNSSRYVPSQNEYHFNSEITEEIAKLLNFDLSLLDSVFLWETYLQENLSYFIEENHEAFSLYGISTKSNRCIYNGIYTVFHYKK